MLHVFFAIPLSCLLYSFYLPSLQPSQSSSSNHVWCRSEVKQLLELGSSVLGRLDAVADGARILVDLVV
uniref:Secreted protein n=1 Tax=Phakopsora pachyrhizi TaxID=170000 RepID=A0A0S1MJV5_PHAPC